MASIKKEDLIVVSQGYMKDADEYRKPEERKWNNTWDVYNNVYDYSDKAPWQAKGSIPKVPNAVSAIQSFFRTSLRNTEKLFRIETDIKRYKDFCYPLKVNCEFWLEKNKFPIIFSKSLLNATITSLLIFKVWWEHPSTPGNIEQTTGVNDDKKQAELDKELEKKTPTEIATQGMYTRGRLRIVSVDPYCFWLDPSGRNKFKIHRYFMDLYDLKEIAGIPSNGYNKEEVKDIDESYPSGTAGGKRMRDSRIKLTHRKEVMIDEYYGDIVDLDGNIVMRDATWSIANEKYAIRMPVYYGEDPFAFGPITEKAFSLYHKSIIEDGVPLARAMTESMNLQQDSNSLSAANMFEIDMDQIHDPEQLKSGMYPMKVLQKESDGSGNPLITPIKLGQYNPQILRQYQELDREFQNAVKMTEFLMGKPASRGRPTATEVEIKSGQSAGFLQDMAISIENNVIEILIQKIYRISMQKQGYYLDPRLEKYGEEVILKLRAMQGMEENERKAILENTFSFKVDGLSKIIGAMEEINKIRMIIDLVGETPMAQNLNLDGVLKKLVRLLGWDEKEMIIEGKPGVVAPELGASGAPVEPGGPGVPGVPGMQGQ